MNRPLIERLSLRLAERQSRRTAMLSVAGLPVAGVTARTVRQPREEGIASRREETDPRTRRWSYRWKSIVLQPAPGDNPNRYVIEFSDGDPYTVVHREGRDRKVRHQKFHQRHAARQDAEPMRVVGTWGQGDFEVLELDWSERRKTLTALVEVLPPDRHARQETPTFPPDGIEQCPPVPPYGLMTRTPTPVPTDTPRPQLTVHPPTPAVQATALGGDPRKGRREKRTSMRVGTVTAAEADDRLTTLTPLPTRIAPTPTMTIEQWHAGCVIWFTSYISNPDPVGVDR